MLDSTHEQAVRTRPSDTDTPAPAGGQASRGARQAAGSRLPLGRRSLGQDAQGDPQAQVGWLDPEPWFPELEHAQGAHQAATAAYGEDPYHLRDQGGLESALAAPQNHYWGMFGQLDADASPDPHERLLEGAAKMGYGVGETQPFLNGNKRTARALVEGFLRANELGHVVPEGHDDEEYADHLKGYGVRLCPTCNEQLDENGVCPTCGQIPAEPKRRHTLQDTIDMFKERHRNGGPNTGYISPYPDEQHFGHVASILDPIHATLDPRVFDHPEAPEPVLRPDVQNWLTTVIFEVLTRHGYDNPNKWLTLVLTGSLTTYQYSDGSDCDVSLFVDAKRLPDWSRAEMIGIMVSDFDNIDVPGTTYPIQAYVVAPGIKPKDLYKPGLRSGLVVYGKGEGHWLVPPDRTRIHDVEKEMNDQYTVGLLAADKMDLLLRYEPDKAIEYWHALHKQRMRDQSNGLGDYSTSNITYKMLSNRGLFPQIANLTGEHIA